MNATTSLILCRPSSLDATARALSVAVRCLMLIVGGSCLSAQQAAFNRSVHVTVTDPLNRFVTGLEQAHFDIVENGIQRPIADFSDVGSPIAIAIVGIVVSPGVIALQRPEDELFQAQTLSDALRKLATAKNSRRALILTVDSDTREVPGSIQVLKADETNLLKTVIEVRNSYSLGFSSSDPTSPVEVMLKEPRGLPPLKLNKK